MGVIQGSMNQLLGTSAIVARLDPNLEKRAQLRDVKKQEETVSKQINQFNLSAEEYEKGETVGAKQFKALEKKQAELAQKRFELEPTKENLKSSLLQSSVAGEGPIMQFPTDPLDIEEAKALEAQQRAVGKGQRQLKMKRKFREYLEQIEPSFSKSSSQEQKELLQQYPKDKRKQIMDAMDKWRVKKNG